MAFDIGAIVARIQADLTGFNAGIDQAKGKASELGDNLQGLASGVRDFANQASVLSAVVGGMLLIGGKQAIDYASNIQQARIQLDAFTGSAILGGKAMAILNQFAKDAPLIPLKDVYDFGPSLISFGLVNKDLSDMPARLREVASASIATHTPVENIIKIFADAKAGILRIGQLGELGTSRQELEKFGAQFTATGHAVDTAKLLPALEKLIDFKFGTLLEKEKNTFAGSVQNIKDDWLRLNAVFMGVDPASGDIKKGGIFDRIQTAANTFFGWLDSHMPQIQAVVQGFLNKLGDAFNYITAALKPLGEWIMAHKDLTIEFLKGLAIGIAAILIIAPIIAVAMNPFILVFSGIALAVASLYTAWNTNFLGIRDITQKVVTEITKFYNEYLKPVLDMFKKEWDAHWANNLATLQAVWLAIKGVIEVFVAIVYGVIKLFLAILVGDHKAAWQAIIDLVKGAWNGLVDIFNGAVNFLRAWGASVLQSLVQPFEDAWHKISDLMNKIKDALDFTKRHSPSVIDIIENGVRLANDALGELAFNNTFSVNPNAAFSSALGGGSTSNEIHVHLSDSIIADDSSAMRVAEKVGDAIMKKLQLNIRI